MLNEKTNISASNLKNGGYATVVILLGAALIRCGEYGYKNYCKRIQNESEMKLNDNKTKNNIKDLEAQNQYEAAQHERAKERKSWN